MTTTTTKITNTPIQNGFWTIVDKLTKEHRTFRIWTEEWDDKKNPGEKKKVRVVGLLTGPNNETDYTNFATLSNDGHKMWVWKRFKRNPGQRMTKFEAYSWIFEDLLVKDGQKWGDRFVIKGSGRCCVCNRKLTTNESIERGIGPKCLANMGG